MATTYDAQQLAHVRAAMRLWIISVEKSNRHPKHIPEVAAELGDYLPLPVREVEELLDKGPFPDAGFPYSTIPQAAARAGVGEKELKTALLDLNHRPRKKVSGFNYYYSADQIVHAVTRIHNARPADS